MGHFGGWGGGAGGGCGGFAAGDDGCEGLGGGGGDGGVAADLVVFGVVQELDAESVVQLLLQADGGVVEEAGEAGELVE